VKLCFTSLAYPELGLNEVLERAITMGFDGVELHVADDGVHLRPEAPLPARVKELLAGFKLPIPVLSSYLKATSLLGEEREHGERTATNLLNMAADIGAIGVRIYGGQLAPDPRKTLRRAGETLETLRRRLSGSQRNVVFLLETHDELAYQDSLRLLVEEYPEAKVLYDPANVIYAGGSHEEAFRLIAEHVAHVHIKDFKIEAGRRIFTLPGEGLAPIRKIVEDLVDHGYAGFVSVEWERFWHRDLPNADLVLPKYLAYLRGIICG